MKVAGRSVSLSVLACCAATLISCSSDTGPRTAASITATTPTSQTAVVGHTVASPPSVVVTDRDGQPVAGATVTFSVKYGGGTISDPAAVTNSNGIATSGSWTLGTVSGTGGGNQIVASIDQSAGGFAAFVVFSAIGMPDAPTTITALADSQTAIIGTPVRNPPQVRVTDTYGNPVPGVPVTFTVGQGGRSLASASPATDANGLATVVWTLGQAGPNTLMVTTATGLSVQIFARAIYPPAVAVRYDGSTCSVILRHTILQGNYTGLALESVWGASASNVFAVGLCHGSPVFMRYDGAAWSTNCSIGSGWSGYTPRSVWGNSPSDMFEVELYGEAAHRWSTILHYDGQAWTGMYDSPGYWPWGATLNAVWSRSPTFAVAVGDTGMVVQYDGTAWDEIPRLTTANLTAVWGAGPSAVFAVGTQGTIYYYDGTTWQPQVSGTIKSLYAVGGTAANDVDAVGETGTVLHYDGNTWTQQASGTTENLRGVWESSPSSVFAVGDFATVVHFDGSQWALQPVTADVDFHSVWGSSGSNVIAVGEQIPRP